jgi:dTDP-4-amino-4,6-dideoxygalactose transaminase
MVRAPEGSDWIPLRAAVLSARAAALSERLREREIEPRSWFCPMDQQPCYADLVRRQIGEEAAEDVFPNARRAYERGILLPVHATLSEEQIEHVCRTIREFYGYR